MKKYEKIVLIGALIIGIVVIGIIVYGTFEPKVEVNSEQIKISGLYGTTINIQEIKGVYLNDDIPKVIKKTNGLELGGVLKGNFKLENIGIEKLFINKGTSPYIYIISNDGKYIIINFKDKAKTQKLYEEIKQVINTTE